MISMTINNRDKIELLKIKYKKWKDRKIKNKDGFFPIWNEFKRFLPVLSGGALRLYIFLGLVSKNDTGESWYSISRLAEELNCSERSIHEWAKELRDWGLIKRYQIDFNGPSYTLLLTYDINSPLTKKEDIEVDYDIPF